MVVVAATAEMCLVAPRPAKRLSRRHVVNVFGIRAGAARERGWRRKYEDRLNGFVFVSS